MRLAIGSAPTGSLRPPTPYFPVVIATECCKGCELCVGACPVAVLALDTTRVNSLGYHPVCLLDAAACTSCAFCARVCPDAVFTVWARPRAGRIR